MKKSKKATHKNRLVQWAVEYLIKERPVEGYPLTDFASLSYELRQGDVLLVEGRSRVCKIIKSLTQSSWSHAVLYIGHVHDIQDQALRKLIAHHVDLKNNPQLCVESVLGQGTIISPLTKYTNEHMRICRAKTIAPHDVQKVVSHALGAIGRPYNIRHIFDLMRLLMPIGIFPRKWRSVIFKPGKLGAEICSSLIAECFHTVDYPILPVVGHDSSHQIVLSKRNVRLFTPSDFDYSPYFDIIKYPMFNMSQPQAYRNLPWKS